MRSEGGREAMDQEAEVENEVEGATYRRGYRDGHDRGLWVGMFMGMALAFMLSFWACGAFAYPHTVTWTAVGDDSLIGTAAKYDMRAWWEPPRTSTIEDQQAWWDSSIVVQGLPEPYESGTVHSVVLDLPAGTIWISIRVRDEAGNWSGFGNCAQVTVIAPIPPDSLPPLPITLTGAGTSEGGSQTHDWISFLIEASEPKLCYFSAYIIDHVDARWNIPLYQAPVKLGPAPVGDGGQDTVWAYLSRNDLPRHLRIIASDSLGWIGQRSNSLVFCFGARADTNYVDLSNGVGWEWTRTRETRPGVWIAEFERARGDSTWLPPQRVDAMRIASQEQVQLAERNVICGQFADEVGPYYALASERKRDCEPTVREKPLKPEKPPKPPKPPKKGGRR